MPEYPFRVLDVVARNRQPCPILLRHTYTGDFRHAYMFLVEWQIAGGRYVTAMQNMYLDFIHMGTIHCYRINVLQ